MTERRKAMQPYLDRGLTPSQAYQELRLAMPMLEQRQAERRQQNILAAPRTAPIVKRKATIKPTIDHGVDCPVSPRLRLMLALAKRSRGR
jgi:hypothetical protein